MAATVSNPRGGNIAFCPLNSRAKLKPQNVGGHSGYTRSALRYAMGPSFQPRVCFGARRGERPELTGTPPRGDARSSARFFSLTRTAYDSEPLRPDPSNVLIANIFREGAAARRACQPRLLRQPPQHLAGRGRTQPPTRVVPAAPLARLALQRLWQPVPDPHPPALQNVNSPSPLCAILALSSSACNSRKRCQLRHPLVLVRVASGTWAATVRVASLDRDGNRVSDSRPGVFFDRVLRREGRLRALLGTSCPER